MSVLNLRLLSCLFSKSSGVNSRQSKKVEQEEKLVRLFQGATKSADSFTQWCEQTLHALSTAHNLDGKETWVVIYTVVKQSFPPS